jgi:hypothetical protein
VSEQPEEKRSEDVRSQAFLENLIHEKEDWFNFFFEGKEKDI